MTILKDYVEAVTKRAGTYKEAEDYYEGLVGETFASAKLRSALRTTGHRGQHNYCRVIVDAVLHRLEIANIVAEKATAQKVIQKVWDDNELHLEANIIHRGALEYGDCYALVWPNADGDLEVSYNSPRTAALVYDPENIRKKLYGVKMWKQPSPLAHGKAQTRMNVYWPDKIQKFVADSEEITEGTNWRGVGEEENPFGEIPVFHFRTDRPYGKPEHREAYGAQNDINKLLSTHFYTIDYQGAPQRYALSMQGEQELVDFGDDETERENVGSLHAEPGSLWYLKGIHQVGQFPAVDPKVFWEPINSLKQSMAALTDTPFHYLEKPMSVSGGQSMRVAEAPLMKKVVDRQTSFAVTWKEIFNFVLKVEGLTSPIEVNWDTVESFDELDVWDVMLKKINAGLSHRQALREGGYDEQEIERIMAERAEEASASSFYNRTDANGQQSLQNVPAARVSTDNNAALNENRNGMTEAAKQQGARGNRAA